jgi:hypothetical protein
VSIETPPDVRARGGAALTPQPHGGALAPPFTPGSGATMGASRKGTSMKAARRQCRDLLAGASEVNTLRLIALCQDADPRVAVVAIKECNDRLWGRVNDNGLLADDSGAALDLSHLSHDQQIEAWEAVQTLRRLTAHL